MDEIEPIVRPWSSEHERRDTGDALTSKLLRVIPNSLVAIGVGDNMPDPVQVQPEGTSNLEQDVDTGDVDAIYKVSNQESLNDL